MGPRTRAILADLARMGWWFLMAVAGLAIIWRLAPHMAEVTLYKLTLAPAAAYVYYRLDRAISERTRPHELLGEAERLRAEAASCTDALRAEKLRRASELEYWARDRYLRRTILIAAGLIAVALAS